MNVWQKNKSIWCCAGSSVPPLSRVYVLKSGSSSIARCVIIIVFVIILTFAGIQGGSLSDLYVVEPLKLEIMVQSAQATCT